MSKRIVTKKCSRCGHPNRPGANFCAICGRRLGPISHSCGKVIKF